MMRPGTKVKCVDAIGSRGSLTVDAIYTVSDVLEDGKIPLRLKLLEDTENRTWWLATRFRA
jgi:hypothetical protein